MKYVSVAEMIAVEKAADAAGHSYAAMMENAGRGLAEVVHARYGSQPQRHALGLVGPGNNGGDTLVAFKYLQQWGWQTLAYLARPRSADDPLIVDLRAVGGEILELRADPDYQALDAALERYPILLDGVLGTGIQLPLRGAIAGLLAHVQQQLAAQRSAIQIVAVDCPSGVDCDRGQVADETLTANLTVTMAAVKQGLLKFPAYKSVGELLWVGIGLPDGFPVFEALKREVVTMARVRRVLPERPLDGHKGTFGTALVVAGSLEYTGAAILAGKAAYRSGAGLVTMAIPAPLHAAIAGHFVEATWLLLPHREGFFSPAGVERLWDGLGRATAMLIGPGFGLQESVADFLSGILKGGRKKNQAFGFVQNNPPLDPDASVPLPPLVMDADGLKLLAMIPAWETRIPAMSILTPHPGEMAVLTGLETGEIQSQRVEIAERYAVEWGHVVVLKGAHTVIAAPDGRTAVIPVATPALARAGTGDVLAGLITGLRAQGVPAFEAALTGAWMHGQAGLRAAQSLGSSAAVLAGDVLAAVPQVLADL